MADTIIGAWLTLWPWLAVCYLGLGAVVAGFYLHSMWGVAEGWKQKLNVIWRSLVMVVAYPFLFSEL